MIKAEDLRVGDLVRYGKDIITILAVHANGGVCFADAEKDQMYAENVLLESIPLTPEILEKNGFEIREGTVAYAKNRLALKPLDEGKGYQVGLGSLRFFYIEVRIVNYVHELQHILWALGEDANLKI
jgi:hypothetical protein